MKKTLRLAMIQEDDPDVFTQRVETFLNEHGFVEIKFQRNLYYSLSGSTGSRKECLDDGKSLCQSHLAFIIWEREEEERRL